MGFFSRIKPKPTELPGVESIDLRVFENSYGSYQNEWTIHGTCGDDEIEFNKVYVVDHWGVKVKVLVRAVTVDKAGKSSYYAQDKWSIEDQYTI